MNNLPQESVLNWSSEKPTLGDIKGKTVLAQLGDKDAKFPGVAIINYFNSFDYMAFFDSALTRWCIIAEKLEPKPLWDTGAEVCQVPQGYFVSLKTQPDFLRQWQLTSPVFPTEAAAITAWNQLVEKIQGER